MSSISSLKTGLYQRLLTELPDYQNIIFNDENGDVWNWTTLGAANDTCQNRNVRDALQNVGAAIVICSPDKRTSVDEVAGETLREARFPILILGNQTTQNAPNHDDLVTDLEGAVIKLHDDCSYLSWELGDCGELDSPGNSVLFALHKYQVGD